MEKGRLKLEDEECIQKNYVELKNNIDPSHIIDQLYSENVISYEDKERITKEQLRSEKNEMLLKVILHSGPGDNFEKFISALRLNYSHLKIVKERSALYVTQKGTNNSEDVQLDKYDTRAKKEVNSYDITVLLVGESRCGKSSTCGTLMRFNREDGPITKSLGYKEINTRLFNGRKINLVDSPSIEHYRRDSQKLINEVQDSIDRASDGFHAFLLIIKYRKVINTEDLEVVKTLKSLYGPEILKNYCVLVLTYGDQLKAENESFKDWCLEQDGEFNSLYEECGRRAVVIDNTIEENEMVTNVLEALIGEIDNLQFNGRKYTTEIFRKAEIGRKRMLIEEKKHNILEDTAAKCVSIIISSSNINAESTEESVKRLHNLYVESVILKDSVKLLDVGTNILIVPLSIINRVQELLSDKIKILNTKETKRKRMWQRLEKEQNKLLKKIDKVMEKLRDEEEKLALKQKVLSLEESNSYLKLLLVKENQINIDFEKVPVLVKHTTNSLNTVNDLNSIELPSDSNTANLFQTEKEPNDNLNTTQNENFKTLKLLAKQSYIEYSQTKYPQTETTVKQDHREQQESYQGSNIHIQKRIACIRLLINISTVVSLLLFIVFVYKNNDKNNFCTEIDSLLDSIQKNVTCLLKENEKRLEMTKDKLRETQRMNEMNNQKIHELTKYFTEMEIVKRNYSILLKRNEKLENNVTILAKKVNTLTINYENYVLIVSSLLESCSIKTYFAYYTFPNFSS